MIVDVNITEKSFGPKVLMKGVKFSVDNSEKVGLIGRNGIGKSTLFGILSGVDDDYTGDIIFKRGSTVVATAQEHHKSLDMTVMEYILTGLPEYAELSRIIRTYPLTMGDNMRKITEYSEALERFEQKGFYVIEEQIKNELDKFQLSDVADRLIKSLSGGQKRLIEVVKVMHSNAQLALIDEPTNHMDYVAKKQFVDWMRQAKEAMIVVTHDRDVLKEVDRIIELKDGVAKSFKGNYDDYLQQNAVSTTTGMNEYEVTQAQIANLKKRVQYARSKKASWGGTADKRNPFVVMENKALKEIKELEKIEKPSFWIDKSSVEALDFKAASRYQKYKTRNIRMSVNDKESRSKHVLVDVKNLAAGYGDVILFEGINFDLREGEAIELRGRNGAGKSTLIKILLSQRDGISIYDGEAQLDQHARVGVYEQEIDDKYFNLNLHDAIERMYLDNNLSISEGKIRSLMADYLFTESDMNTEVSRLSGGQKARLQIIDMLKNDPQLLILDEPTNHLDLPSIEELEIALEKYSGAVLFVSHDGYFRQSIGGDYIQIGAK